MNISGQYTTVTSPQFADSPVSDTEVYDLAVIGGGLAGLSLSIQVARAGYKVILFEKEKYPFHRVCGEYISLECWNFLENLGYPLSELDLPLIKKLVVSAPNGSHIEHDLPLGGFGISRFKIDSELAEIARASGVYLVEGKRVTDVIFRQQLFTVYNSSSNYTAKVVCGTFGKRSNLDLKWKRPFVNRKPNKLNNYVGVKYHIEFDHPPDTIALHNFKNGYCGISRIEEGKHCLCYLTTAANLKANNNSIPELERNILQKNPFLKNIFREGRIIYQAPLTISQVSFENKSQVEDHMLMVGDAGGMITPLCGNGMSMALHGSKIAADLVMRFLLEEITRPQLERLYIHQWNQLFKKRLLTGRFIQRMFGSTWLTNVFIHALKPFPKFTSFLIRQTHGEPF